MTLRKKSFENIVGKGENVFSLFPTIFSALPKIKISLSHIYFVVCKVFQFEPSKILLFGTEFTYLHDVFHQASDYIRLDPCNSRCLTLYQMTKF